MTNSRKKIVAMYGILLGTMVSSLSMSLAWFVTNNKFQTGQITASVLSQYFHCGIGTAEDPFIITRPQHFENLVWLHNNVTDFWKALDPEQTAGGYGFYFEVGCSLNRLENPADTNHPGTYTYEYDNTQDPNAENRYVFNYDDGGAVSGNPSHILNLNYLKNPFIPIGSGETPFIGSFTGNGNTIKSFDVAASYTDDKSQKHGFTDIGVFGYVGEHGTVDNTYFSNFKIDINGNTVDQSESTKLDHTPHETHRHKDTAYIGYLAGHALKSGNFTDCYVNDCEIIGSNGNNNTLDNYSYFGMVDVDNGGGTYGTGGDYKFTLDSSAVYNYFASRYDVGTTEDIGGGKKVSTRLKDTPLRFRNSGYTHESNTLPSEEEYNATGVDYTTGVGVYPLSNAMTTGGDWISGNGYDLVGKNRDNSTITRSFSLSTLGYNGAQYETEVHNDLIFYKAAEDDYEKLPENTTESDHPLDEDKSGNPNGQNSRYFNSSKGYWEYYQSFRYVDKTPRTIEVTLPSKWSFNTAAIHASFRDNNATLTVNFYLDDSNQAFSSMTRSITAYTDTWLLSSRVDFEYNSGESNTFKIEVPAGIHTFCVLTDAHFDASGSFGSNQHRYFPIGSSVDRNNAVSYLEADVREKNYSQSFDKFSASGNNSQYSRNVGPAFKDYVKDYQGKTSLGPYPLYCAHYEEWDEEDPVTHEIIHKRELVYDDEPFDDQGATFNYEEYSYIDEETGEKVVTGYDWYAYYSKAIKIEGSDRDHFVAGSNDANNPDDPDNKGNQIYESGYRYNNIDVVGGRVNFSNRFITIEGIRERDLTNLSPTLTNNHIGQKFYAPAYASTSVVLYMKNTGGSKPDDYMGYVKFYYELSLFGSSVKEPGFRGANGTYYGFDDFSAAKTAGELYDPDDYVYDGPTWLLDLSRTASIVFRRGYIKKSAYCALDKDGNIIAGYDKNGNQTVPTDRTVEEREIDTYVLIFGVISPSSIINTRISKVEFEYKAIAGAGGTFGSVGYRDAPDKIETTILNFYIETNTQMTIQYRVVVKYENGTYNITFEADNNAGGDFFMNVFLYDDAYTVLVNGTEPSSLLGIEPRIVTFP